MLLVGTQPLRSQHPPLTPLPLGSAIPPQQAGNRPPGRGENTQRLYTAAKEFTGYVFVSVCFGLTLDSVMKSEEDWETDGCPCFFGSIRRRKNGGNITLRPLPLGVS